MLSESSESRHGARQGSLAVTAQEPVYAAKTKAIASFARNAARCFAGGVGEALALVSVCIGLAFISVVKLVPTFTTDGQGIGNEPELEKKLHSKSKIPRMIFKSV